MASVTYGKCYLWQYSWVQRMLGGRDQPRRTSSTPNCESENSPNSIQLSLATDEGDSSSPGKNRG